MSQQQFIKDIAKYGLENDQQKLIATLQGLIDFSRKGKRTNLAIQLQSLLKDAIRDNASNLTKVGSKTYIKRVEDRELDEIILEKLTSDYNLDNIITSDNVQIQLQNFIKEHTNIELLRKHGLTVSNKLLLYGPSGCGKTLASYVLAGELNKMMIVVNLGAIVSSKLGETSKNLAKLFRKAASEDCIIFFDEFDSLGKVRDYNQDHGEMKRVVNTILQLFDYLPQESIVIAATNQKDMLDSALTRRFDTIVEFPMPGIEEIKNLISKIIQKADVKFDSKIRAKNVIKLCIGLSYYSIQKSLITALKQSLFELTEKSKDKQISINTRIWKELVIQEQSTLSKS